jgi:hypothetical protein
MHPKRILKSSEINHNCTAVKIPKTSNFIRKNPTSKRTIQERKKNIRIILFSVLIHIEIGLLFVPVHLFQKQSSEYTQEEEGDIANII